jgi:hypothetical protein
MTKRQKLPSAIKTYQQIANHFGVSAPGVKQWVWLTDRTMSFPEMEAAKIAYETANSTGQNAPTTLNDARLAKLKRETERLDIKIKKEKGELVLKDEVREAVQKIIAILCSEGVAMCGDLPGQLEGLDAANMRPKITARWELMLSNAKERFSEI